VTAGSSGDYSLDSEATGGRGVEQGPKTSELVARRIVQDITVAGLGPGDVLPPEAAMLKRYGVGRASLREALRILEFHGLVMLKPGPRGGPVVMGIDPQRFGRMATMYLEQSGATFDELLGAAMLLEPILVRRITEQADDETLAAIGQVVASASDHTGEVETPDNFHAILARVPGNRVLELISASVGKMYRDYFVVEAAAGANQVHGEIAEAIVEGDASKAEQLMRAHMDALGERLRQQHREKLAEGIGWV
jgi:DNA-binding FadR family transcriptional regulator